MKRKISFKLFFSVLWRGLCQVLLFFCRLFGIKDGCTYTRKVWLLATGIIATLILLISMVLLWSFLNEVVYRKWLRPYTSNEVYICKNISNHIVFQKMYFNHEGQIYDNVQNKVLMKSVDWVYKSKDNDSLAVFSQNGRRGYLSRYTGKIVIPAIYTRAWVFSEGLAAVERDGELLFIDHSGQTVIDKKFEVAAEEPEYVFINGYCRMQDTVSGKNGLIDRRGNWALKPEYDQIWDVHGLWKVEKEGLCGVFSETMDTLCTPDKIDISVYEDAIDVRLADHTAKRLDHKGNVLVDFVIDEISDIHYDTTTLYPYESDGVYSEATVGAVADCLKYMVRNGYAQYYGLMDRNGKRITPPDYESIEAITKDLYLCLPQGVIINNQGKRVTDNH